MDTLTSLEVFCSVAELKSFSAAADRLGISPAMASKHVMHLERRISARLLNRTSRRVSLTESGALYLEQTSQLLDGLRDVEEAVGNTNCVARGTLRLSAPAWFANPMFAGMLAEFCEHHPEVHFDLDLSGRLLNLVEEGFDLAIRATPLETLDPGLIARPLGEIAFHLVASPDFLDRSGRPGALSDLNGWPFLQYGVVRSNGSFALESPAGTETVRFEVILQSGNETMLRMLAHRGMGLTFLPRWTLAADLEEGRLELVLPDSYHAGGVLHAVYPSRKYLSAKVRAFIDFVIRDPRLKEGPLRPVICSNQETVLQYQAN